MFGIVDCKQPVVDTLHVKESLLGADKRVGLLRAGRIAKRALRVRFVAERLRQRIEVRAASSPRLMRAASRVARGTASLGRAAPWRYRERCAVLPRTPRRLRPRRRPRTLVARRARDTTIGCRPRSRSCRRSSRSRPPSGYARLADCRSARRSARESTSTSDSDRFARAPKDALASAYRPISIRIEAICARAVVEGRRSSAARSAASAGAKLMEGEVTRGDDTQRGARSLAAAMRANARGDERTGDVVEVAGLAKSREVFAAQHAPRDLVAPGRCALALRKMLW